MHLYNAAGIVTDNELETEKKVWTTFLMKLVGFDGTLDKPDGSFREARHHASGKGFFLTSALKGVITVSKRLGIGVCEAIFLRLHLGRSAFDALLAAHNVIAGPDHPSPIEIDSPCRTGSSDASSCPHGNQAVDDK